MRKVTSLFLVTVGLFGFGCGDDSATGGNNNGGSGAGNTGGDNTGAGNTGGNNPGGGNVGGDGNGGAPVGGDGPGGFGPGFSCDDPTGTPPALTLTSIADLDEVIQIKSPPGAPDKLFMVRQSGEIRIYENGALVDTPFIDVGDLIKVSSEEGLLGLAFHPDYATNGRFFLHYSATGGGASTVSEFTVSADPNVANPDPVQLVLQHPTQFSNHNGGAVEFGPSDGFLYISMGDGGGGGDEECDAQDLANLWGKIIRLDVDGTPDANGYPAAAGNPNNAKYYHIGLRNPWRMSFDACTDDLYIGDVGQGQYEEVDVITTADGPINGGWPVREGMHAFGGYNGACDSDPANPLEPIAEYNHGEGCSISGGYVYRGSTMPGLRGWYFYADYCSGNIWMLRAVDGAIVDAVADAGINGGSVSAFGQDGNGEVYVSDYGGTVYKIEAE